MGFFSRLFGTSSTTPSPDPPQTATGPGELSRFRPPHVTAMPAEANALAEPDPIAPVSFAIEWKAAPRFPATIHDAQVLVTDVEGLTDVDLRAVTSTSRAKTAPLIVVSPGLDPSGQALTGLGEVVSVRALPLPGQPLRDLLIDLAALTGARALTSDLGFAAATAAPDEESIPKDALDGLVLPDVSWADVSESDLGTIASLQIEDGRCSFCCTAAQWPVRRIEYLQQDDVDSDREGLRIRLRRFGRAQAAIRPPQALQPATDPSAAHLFAGYASPYFLTDAATSDAVLERPRVLLSSRSIERLAFLLPVLQHGVRESSPVVVIAPAVGSRALATMVVNKLRGLVSCVAIELGGSGDAIDSTLAGLAAVTNAEILSSADATLPRDRIAGILGTAARVVASRSSSTIWSGDMRVRT